jgi:hypothetical protein
VCVFTAQCRLDAAVESVLLFSSCLCCFSPNYIRKQFLTSPTTDLPNIINKTTVPITFTDDTNILFAHYNLTDFNKNIHIFFATLNKWFTANQLSLNFNNTNYVHFTTKGNMVVNIKIGFKNNLITNSSYRKFLGVTMGNILS